MCFGQKPLRSGRLAAYGLCCPVLPQWIALHLHTKTPTYISAPSQATHTPIWLRNIKDDPVVVTAADCTTAANGCSASPSTICPFISFCGNGSPVLLETNLTTGALPTGGKCTYAACPAA